MQGGAEDDDSALFKYLPMGTFDHTVAACAAHDWIDATKDVVQQDVVA
jgi:hypothetical protein